MTYTIVDGATRLAPLREELDMSTTRFGATAPPAEPILGAEPDDAVGVGEPRSTDGQVSRRQWVRQAAIAGTVVAAGAGLAACGTSAQKASGPAPGSVPATTSSTGTGATAPTTSGTAPAATSPTAPAVTGDATPPSLVVGKVSTIPVGGGVIYPSHGVVVTQPTAGTFKCFSSSCTHLGCTVNKVAAGLIQCPCHGARFGIDDGSVKAGPAPRPLTVEQFTVQDGVVVLD
jgi:Rieske Fe-S protein